MIFDDPVGDTLRNYLVRQALAGGISCRVAS